MAAGRSQPVLYTFVLATLEWLRTSRTVGLLDVGCGRGHLLTVLAAAGYSDLTGCDGLEHPDLCLRCVFQQEEIAKAQVRVFDFRIDKKFPTRKATVQSVAENLFDAESVMSEQM